MICATSATNSPIKLMLTVGEVQYLPATVCPPDAHCKRVIWNSSNAKIASVDASGGQVIAHSEGTATIYAQAQDGNDVIKEYIIYVYIPVEKVELNKKRLELSVGKHDTLTATVYPANASTKVVHFSSSDSNVAIVDQNGRVAAKGYGYAIITAKSAYDAYAQCTVCVGEEFNYSSTTFNSDLAVKCAEYAMLAYDEMIWTDTGYVDSDKRSDPPIPKQLNTKLEQDDFINIVNCNYDDNNDITANHHNVSFSLATKPILLNGSPRTLVTVIIRGTDGVEWKGNMDITGTSYDPSMNDHYSFKQAEIDLRTNSKNGLQKYLTTYGITNPVYLITGHSRGAAVANLLADTLSQDIGSSNVFAYTFATPNNTKKPVLRSNIFNFCFENDFVSQVPLNEWGYRKHGVTFTGNVEDFYKSNSAFRANIERYVTESKDMDKITFAHENIQDLIDHIAEKWPTAEDYYQKQILITDIRPLSVWGQPSAARTLTLYEFFRKYIAPAAINGNPGILVYCIHPDFGRIARFLVSGDRVKLFNDYIYNVHNAFTYYTAIKYNLFPT